MGREDASTEQDISESHLSAKKMDSSNDLMQETCHLLSSGDLF